MNCTLEEIFAMIEGKGEPRAVSGAELWDIEPALFRNSASLFELSAAACDAVIHAWMSELPITAAIIRFGQKVLAAAEQAGRDRCGGQRQEAERRAAETAAADRGDRDVQTVLEAAHKTRHETHRLMGLLRFSPGADGVYIARCEPDHYILPSLGEYFEQRFGSTPWAVIDEKRRLCLRGGPGSPPRIHPLEQAPRAAPAGDPWESLWKRYHQTINNESRNNPRLQRQCMPRRYWKYLPEM
jgi:probable DNA metabolism protein